jgi:hypothetical protein
MLSLTNSEAKLPTTIWASCSPCSANWDKEWISTAANEEREREG